MPLIKICGITNIEDRNMCLNEGTDLLGFNLYEGSKRYVNREQLKVLLSSEVRKYSVLVGVNKGYDEWVDIIDEFSPGYVQLHGNEEVDIIKRIKLKFPEVLIIKKLNISHRDRFEYFLENADYLLCDTETVEYGGSGKRFDWENLSGINKEIKDKMFVAGGVDCNNVDELLPYDVFGIDIASGSESSPGCKDIVKVKNLIKKVKNYGK